MKNNNIDLSVKEQIIQIDSENVMQTYGRHDVVFVRGKGSRLYDSEGKEYIDFGSGIGVSALGYGHPGWVSAVSAQAETLAHVSNLFYTKPYAELAARLIPLSGMREVFFSNSGAESVEGAIKLARKYSRDKYGDGRSTIVTLLQSFHGRTVTALSATGQETFHDHFSPFTEGFKYAAANESEDLKKLLTEDVCAVMVEPIQGEGGVTPLTEEFVEALFNRCREKDILVIFDEVQTGMGRTGEFYAWQHFGLPPDIMTSAKGLGGGLPIGAVFAGEKCRGVLSAGHHGSTYGGNPVCCAGALAVLDVLEEPGFLKSVVEKGNLIRKMIEGWNTPQVAEVRGKGLMLGIQLKGVPPKQAAADLLQRGLVILTAGKDVLRLLPPLVIGQEDIEEGLVILKEYLEQI